MRVLGIDPGTSRWNFFGVEKTQNNSTVFLELSIPTHEIGDNPLKIQEILDANLPLDAIVAPSGFGFPLTPIQQLTTEDLSLMTLRNPQETQIMGLTQVLSQLQQQTYPVYVTPGVKHFATVPAFRKVNLLDMGTADKVCSVVMGLQSLKTEYNTWNDLNFILLEIGHGFTALVAVEGGKIIDGIGGTNIVGFSTIGKIDAELAYLMHIQTKKAIYQGGLTSMLQKEVKSSEKDEKISHNHLVQSSLVTSYFLSQIKKAIVSLESSFTSHFKNLPVLISGNAIEVEWLVSVLENYLPSRFLIQQISTKYKGCSVASQGAAVIAEGISNGESRTLLEHMELFSAKGSILDMLFVPLAFP